MKISLRLSHVNEGILVNYESLVEEKYMLDLANETMLLESKSLLEEIKRDPCVGVDGKWRGGVCHLLSIAHKPHAVAFVQ